MWYGNRLIINQHPACWLMATRSDVQTRLIREGVIPMAKKYDVAAKVGVYKDDKGQEKPTWVTIGSMHEGDKGPFLLLAKWFNPAAVEGKPGSDHVLLSLFEQKPKEG